MASDLIITAEKMASIVLGELSDEALGGSWAGPGYFVRQMDEVSHVCCEMRTALFAVNLNG